MFLNYHSGGRLVRGEVEPDFTGLKWSPSRITQKLILQEIRRGAENAASNNLQIDRGDILFMDQRINWKICIDQEKNAIVLVISEAYFDSLEN